MIAGNGGKLCQATSADYGDIASATIASFVIIQDAKITVLVLEIGHRKEVHRSLPIGPRASIAPLSL